MNTNAKDTKLTAPYVATFTQEWIQTISQLTSQILGAAVLIKDGWVSRLPHTNIHLEYTNPISEGRCGSYRVSELAPTDGPICVQRGIFMTSDFREAVIFILTEMKRVAP